MDKDCEKFERLISDRLDGEISPAEESALQVHLRGCEKCRRFEDSARVVREQLHLLPDMAADVPGLSSPERIKGTDRFWVKRISLPVPAAAALAVLMMTGWLLALSPRGESTVTSPPRSVLVRSVEIIQVQPAQATSVKPSPGDSPNKKEDEI